MQLCLWGSSQGWIKWGGKTYPKCGWHHSKGWWKALNTKEKAYWATAFVSPCFLTADAALASCLTPQHGSFSHHDGMFPERVNQNKASHSSHSRWIFCQSWKKTNIFPFRRPLSTPGDIALIVQFLKQNVSGRWLDSFNCLKLFVFFMARSSALPPMPLPLQQLMWWVSVTRPWCPHIQSNRPGIMQTAH